MGASSISAATVGRLPRYLEVLADLARLEASTVSSDRLAELVGVNPATLRRDLSSLQISGTRGVGYDVKGLIFAIGVALGVNQDWPVVVVGAGNLGRALANHHGLAERGFPVRALCDVDANKVGTVIGDLSIDHVDNLAGLVDKEGIAIGVIATATEGAQQAADDLVAAGVRSILNFSPSAVDVPDGIVVRRVDLATELQILSFYQQRGVQASAGTGVPLPPRP